MVDKPTLIITVGLIGTGKTTIAKALADRLGLEYISSDITRKRLAGIPVKEHRYEEYNEGIYSARFTDEVYDTMLTEADSLLSQGKSVIIDASFVVREWRLWTENLAKDNRANFYAVECRCDEGVIKEHLANRRDTPSDGTWETYLEQKKTFEPVSELSPKEHIVVGTAKSLGGIIGEIERCISST